MEILLAFYPMMFLIFLPNFLEIFRSFEDFMQISRRDDFAFFEEVDAVEKAE